MVSAGVYGNHQKRKGEKESEMKSAQERDDVLAYAVDMQKVLTWPDIKVSITYYKTELKFHNWSVLNLVILILIY